MCGIAGFIGKGTIEQGRAMIQSIAYRGPDYQGVAMHENVCLTHARLSIIDLSADANQPMYSSDKKIAIVFNGEIYNFMSLKAELQKTGKYTFHTTSDTEVLIYLYREYGRKMLEKIHGMFVFALYDFDAKEMLLARDRMGKKPLYYGTCEDGTFIFASELKAFYEHPSAKKEINVEAINQYLTFDYVPAPSSINKGVLKLEPAHYLIIKNGILTEKASYWKHNFTTNTTISFEEAKTKLDQLLNDATAARLMSDVPLGVFLSGGLDSSTVAYYAQKNAQQKIKTFSIGFEDKSYDEQDYALQVANHLGTEHHVSVLTPSKTVDLISEIFPKLDEPFADASIIPTYYLSKFTRQKVTVALGGDGSDELLAGYPTFISERYKNWVQMLPQPMKQLMNQAANLLPASDKNISFDFKVKQFLRGFSSHSNHIHQLWLGSFLPVEKKSLFKKHIFESLKDASGLQIIDFHFNENGPQDAFNKILYYYYQTYLPDDILFKVDRASMYNSLEVRAPFLDTHVVEFLNSLPRNFKHQGNELKFILKKVMENKIPHNIIYRPKKGFGIPLSDWIRKDLKNIIEDVLLSQDDYFERNYIEKILREHQSKKHNHRKLIWNLFVLKGYFLNR
ncbi:MAG: asparagine synthase (glutamine-hydrolyzing) [Bacteroidetes bacterium]|nr:asparagine synthase (glutamine-hydrolyzing) [Bacteroidota bacterium]